jgi:hypothetical protein
MTLWTSVNYQYHLMGRKTWIPSLNKSPTPRTTATRAQPSNDYRLYAKHDKTVAKTSALKSERSVSVFKIISVSELLLVILKATSYDWNTLRQERNNIHTYRPPLLNCFMSSQSLSLPHWEPRIRTETCHGSLRMSNSIPWTRHIPLPCHL